MQLRSLSRIGGLVAGALMFGAVGAAQADVRYNFPQVNGAIVDWCASWAANCGAGGANQFCQQRGHPGGARNYTVYRPGRTWVIGASTYCNGPNCQGFSQVTCIAAAGPGPGPAAPPPTSTVPVPGGMRINYPQANGAIIDWCASWAANCGAGGANLVCQQRGFGAAMNWAVYNPGRTWVLGSATYCNGGNCRGFSYVACSTGAPVNPGPAIPPMSQVPIQGGITIYYPRLGAAILDWCTTMGDNCGNPVANRYCQTLGYNRADDIHYFNPGRTYVWATNQYCNGPSCRGFQRLNCVNY